MRTRRINVDDIDDVSDQWLCSWLSWFSVVVWSLYCCYIICLLSVRSGVRVCLGNDFQRASLRPPHLIWRSFKTVYTYGLRILLIYIQIKQIARMSFIETASGFIPHGMRLVASACIIIGLIEQQEYARALHILCIGPRSIRFDWLEKPHTTGDWMRKHSHWESGQNRINILIWFCKQQHCTKYLSENNELIIAFIQSNGRLNVVYMVDIWIAMLLFSIYFVFCAPGN